MRNPTQEASMAETKTKPTAVNVEGYLASKGSPEQVADCKAIMAICQRLTGQPPRMWGPSIVGFGSYTYRYESGHSGEACIGTTWQAQNGQIVFVLQAPGGSRPESARSAHCRLDHRTQSPLPKCGRGLKIQVRKRG
jgi:hypothetical protein